MFSVAYTKYHHPDLWALVWDGGGPLLGHGWSRDGHCGAPRSRSRPVTSLRVGSWQSRRWASDPGLYRSPRRSRSLTDASLARRKSRSIPGTHGYGNVHQRDDPGAQAAASARAHASADRPWPGTCTGAVRGNSPGRSPLCPLSWAGLRSGAPAP